MTAPLLAALLGLLLLAGSTGAAGRLGIGRMTVAPGRVTAGTTGLDLTFTFTADSAPLSGQTIVDVAPGWTLPQKANPAGPGFVEVQAAGCTGGTRIRKISRRRITIATVCGRRQSYRLLYRHVDVPRLATDGYVFLTQTRSATTRRKVVFRPLGPRKQPIVRVRGAAAAGLFMSVTSFSTAGTPFTATVRAIDAYGNNAADYAGTVTLTSSDPAATLPGSYAFGPTDAAQHIFTGIVLRTQGTQTLTATDSAGRTVQSGPITVTPSSGVTARRPSAARPAALRSGARSIR